MQPSASGGTAHCRWCTDATVDQFDDAIATVAVGLSGDSVMPPTQPLRGDENQAQKRCRKRQQLAEGRRTFASWRNLLAGSATSERDGTRNYRNARYHFQPGIQRLDWQCRSLQACC